MITSTKSKEVALVGFIFGEFKPFGGGDQTKRNTFILWCFSIDGVQKVSLMSYSMKFVEKFSVIKSLPLIHNVECGDLLLWERT